MAPRDRPRNRSSKALNEEYALLVDGAPLNCRWQELKDYIREYAPHSRQAEMYPDANGKPTGCGSVIIRGLEEGQRAYEALSRKGWDGHCITVALAKRVSGGSLVTLEGPTTSPNLPTRMPNSASYTTNSRHVSVISPAISPRSSRHPGYSPAVDSQAAYYATTATYQPVLAARQMADTSNLMAVHYSTTPRPPAYTQYENAHYGGVNTAPEYHQSVIYCAGAPAYTNGNHVAAPNMSRHAASRPQVDKAPSATIVSLNRTVFLTKLPYNAVGHAVRRLLEPFGRVERCDVPLDRISPNKIQGTAIAKFKETNDAARAIRDLNGFKWRGVIISARWDKDAASTSSDSSSSVKPFQARHGSSRTGRVTEARRDDKGACDQRRRAGEGPLIVNGSRGRVAPSQSRRGSREDESDSSENDVDDEDESSGDKGARSVSHRISGRHH